MRKHPSKAAQQTIPGEVTGNAAFDVAALSTLALPLTCSFEYGCCMSVEVRTNRMVQKVDLVL